MSTVFPYVYKFRGRFPALIVCGLMTGLLTVFAVLVAREGDSLGGTIFLFAGSIFFFLIGRIFFIGKTNIVVNDDSISRTIFGKPFKTIQWKDVERITTFPVRDSGVSQNVTGYNVIAARGASSLSNTKKIFFSNQGNDVSGLLECLNTCVTRFNIRAERESDGTTVDIKSI